MSQLCLLDQKTGIASQSLQLESPLYSRIVSRDTILIRDTKDCLRIVRTQVPIDVNSHAVRYSVSF